MTREEAIAAGLIVPESRRPTGLPLPAVFAPIAERIFFHNRPDFVERYILDESKPYAVRLRLHELAEAARSGRAA